MRMPTFKKGDIPKASDLDMMAREIERLANFRVAEGSGLTLSDSATGFVVGQAQRPACRYAVTNSVIPKWTGTGPGKGTGTVYRTTYSPTDVATSEAISTTSVDIYNGSNFDVPSGQRIMVELIQGRWHIITHFCSAT